MCVMFTDKVFPISGLVPHRLLRVEVGEDGEDGGNTRRRSLMSETGAHVLHPARDQV